MQDTPLSLLVRLRREPAERDWQQLVEVFTPVLASWARRMGVPATDLEDVLQDLYSTLIRQLPEFDYNPDRSFRGWLWTVLYRQVLAWKKKQYRERDASLEHFFAMENSEHIEEASEQAFRQMILNRILQLVKHEFPDRTWQIFMELTLEGRSGNEVASRFGVSRNMVYLARSRVLARIRNALSDLNIDRL